MTSEQVKGYTPGLPPATPFHFDTRVSAARYRAWLRQCDTIEKKAEKIFSEMMDELGEDSFFTDLADEVVNVAENLGDALLRAIDKRKQAISRTGAA